MLLELLLKFKKPLLCVLAALLLLGSGYYYGLKHSTPIVKTEIKEVTIEKIVEKKVFVEVKVKDEHEQTKTVIVKNKDGSETTTIDTVKDTKEDTSTKSESTKESEKIASKETTITPTAKSYRVGAFAVEKLPSLSDFVLSKPDYQVMAGRRILGSLWVEAGYQVKQNSAVLGLSWEF